MRDARSPRSSRLRPLARLAGAASAAAALLTGCAREAPVTPELEAKWDGASLWQLEAESLAGEPVDLSAYRGKVAVVVNVASRCGFTPQYAGLQQLWEELGPDELVVLGFPSDDFGGQELATAGEIRAFCDSEYGVTFPMFAKVATQPGEAQSPVYEFLGTATGSLPGWNFGKYVVGRDGRPIAFFGSRTGPDAAEFRAAIDEALAADAG